MHMIVGVPFLYVSLLCIIYSVNMYHPVLHVRRGLITRNVKEAVDIFHERFGVSSIFLMGLSAHYNDNLQLSVRFLISGIAAAFYLICFGIGAT